MIKRKSWMLMLTCLRWNAISWHHSSQIKIINAGRSWTSLRSEQTNKIRTWNDKLASSGLKLRQKIRRLQTNETRFRILILGLGKKQPNYVIARCNYSRYNPATKTLYNSLTWHKLKTTNEPWGHRVISTTHTRIRLKRSGRKIFNLKINYEISHRTASYSLKIMPCSAVTFPWVNFTNHSL